MKKECNYTQTTKTIAGAADPAKPAGAPSLYKQEHPIPGGGREIRDRGHGWLFVFPPPGNEGAE